MKAKEIFFYGLGLSIVIGFFTITGFLVFKGGYESTVNILIGTMAMAFGSVVGYYFGTSKSSADKTDMIYNSTKNP